MMRKLLKRMYNGFAITVMVCLVVQLLVAQLAGHTVTPGFRALFRSESAAVLAQLGLTGVIGMTFAAAAAVFEMERWSFLKQGVVHFLITAVVWMPIAWLCWSPLNGRGLLYTILGWTATYAVNWTVQYFIWRRSVSEINRRIHAFREREDGI